MSATRTVTRPSPRSLLVAAAAGAIALIALFAATASAKPGAGANKNDTKPTNLLVDGAFARSSRWGGLIKRVPADRTGWGAVIRRPQADGYRVIAPANPLRSLSSDSAYISSGLAQTPGPLV